MNNELKIIKLNKSKDKRGYLTKIFDQNIKINNKFNFIVKEHLISLSKKNVIRGMHYQSSNYAQNKIVYVIEGTIIDVIVNIRKKSKNYLKVYDFSLSSKKNLGIFIPKYYAHGFKVTSNYAVVGYLLDNNYNKKNDKGILWKSINYNWKVTNPILSNKDSKLPPVK
tara:strand:- start:9486 stop:9986 length:501 start_codon:yes stop_codon:yes gene_type:complete